MILNNTKERILRCAARLFSEKGYDKITIRDIAKEADINPSSLYFHFSSKGELLKTLYDLFSMEVEACRPDLKELLLQAETNPPHEVLTNARFHFDEDKQEMLDQIEIIAVRRLGSDPESENFIKKNIFDVVSEILQPVLVRMMELRRIQPLDIEAFIGIFQFYNLSAGILDRTSLGHNLDQYYASMAWFFSMIVPIEG